MGLTARMVVSIAAAAALVLSACGGDGSSSPEAGEAPATTEQQAANNAGMQHIHGLGVRRGALYIATHHGLWIAPKGQTKAHRLGASRQDIMGFSVLSEDRFIGSGHPHPFQQDLPPNLGLIESRDGGRSWKNVSLSGEADFHVLQSVGTRIYGFDGVRGRLLTSSNNGRSWQPRTPPAGVYALAIDPHNPRRIVASTEKGVFMSPNTGDGWRPLNDRLAGLLAWPRTARLYLVDGEGTVRRSGDGGRQWQTLGAIGGPPAAFIAAGTELYAALADGTVKRSTDGGNTWTLRATP